MQGIPKRYAPAGVRGAAERPARSLECAVANVDTCFEVTFEGRPACTPSPTRATYGRSPCRRAPAGRSRRGRWAWTCAVPVRTRRQARREGPAPDPCRQLPRADDRRRPAAGGRHQHVERHLLHAGRRGRARRGGGPDRGRRLALARATHPRPAAPPLDPVRGRLCIVGDRRDDLVRLRHLCRRQPAPALGGRRLLPDRLSPDRPRAVPARARARHAWRALLGARCPGVDDRVGDDPRPAGARRTGDVRWRLERDERAGGGLRDARYPAARRHRVAVAVARATGHAPGSDGGGIRGDVRRRRGLRSGRRVLRCRRRGEQLRLSDGVFPRGGGGPAPGHDPARRAHPRGAA